MLEQIDTAIAFSVIMLMLSLIVTALVQVIAALLDLRGRNLALGLRNLFQQIEPTFREKLSLRASVQEVSNQGKDTKGGAIALGAADPGRSSRSTIAEYLADIVVKHPAVAHAGTRAKAISYEELVCVLRDLCSDHPAATIDETVKAKLKGLLDARVPGGAKTLDGASAVVDQLGAKFPALKDEIKVTVDAAFATVSKLEQQVGQWFDTIMNRLSDIFTRKTRVITVLISLLLVVALQIDSGEILRQITNNEGLRAKLAAMSDTALSQANKIFDNGERATAALADIKKQNEKDVQIVAALDKETPHLTRCVDGKNWLIENIKTLPNAEKIEQEFDKACQEETLRAMGNSYDQIRGLQSDLQKADLKIIPQEVGGLPVFDSSEHWLTAYSVRRHLVGTLVSIIFLSLGAPFWFNTLRQLSNLKPAIAGKVEEPKQGEEKSTSVKTAKAN
jgi:hypothetical protein